MKPDALLAERSGNICEMCKSADGLQPFDILPKQGKFLDHTILLCTKCRNQVDKKEEPDANHWKCLSETMWSEVSVVQLLSWRMLNRFKNESWAADLLDMMYMDEDQLTWAKASGDQESGEGIAIHRDSNGNILVNGDTVVLVKSLDVKGSSLTAKIGTIVRNIHLVADNTEQIEGKVDGQLIVILTKYVRKQLG